VDLSNIPPFIEGRGDGKLDGYLGWRDRAEKNHNRVGRNIGV
jgi:hypothetical protein